MCGIAGYIGREALDAARIAPTLGLMRNRGPDHRDSASFQSGDLHIALLHSRLSILDLDARSNQPFEADDCVLVFNGEIYNYVELRQELVNRGVVLKTSSDTEVLLHYYLLHGDDCVSHFEGMWSFAIYDRRKHRLLLSRDRFAEKPLYYTQTDGGIYFASEPKFIQSLSGQALEVNERQVLRYMVNGYKSLYKQDETFFRNVREVPFATNVVIGDDLSVSRRSYWRPEASIRKMTAEDAVAEFKERLMDSIRIRLRADVPLAFCLSGGIDSAGIASIASKCFGYDVATFSIIDSDERYNESENIQAVLDDLGCRHELIETSREGFFERLSDLVSYHDAPVYTISYYVHSFLSQAISEQGYKVAFSGTGADELVTGYYDHFILHLYEMRNSARYGEYEEAWQRHTGQYVRNPHLKNPRLYMEDPTFRGHVYMDADEYAACLKVDFNEGFIEEDYADHLLHNRMMNEMFHEGTRVILHEDDLNSMRYSVENRSPYLDSRLFEMAYSIPIEHLIRDGYGKSVLREALEGILVDDVRLDRRKKGFNASIQSLVDFTHRETRDRIMDDGPIFDLVDREKVERLMGDGHMTNSVSKFLFYLLSAKTFMELFAS